ncbi:Chromosome partition protein Smc [Symmachiella dynata]|uniref:Chromosome partition protein Smc n=1 Tax=Symmachiella dynata TaxID=2527995 RepID=A0A517ZQ16_9PLAN|nr:YhaN family protein [Symmachiella dynata]QDU44537.1 Chromosome partition protein Smc [Symmachiella dynata]
MKVLRLDLRAFGPFTNVTLSPDDGKFGLHIVYGPNEAGKSSSLRALRQWLYGIPHNSTDDFVHQYSDMRIGGVLEHDGKRLEFIRRKGRIKTIRAADDTDVIDDVELSRVLGGVDETAFSHRFGVDYEELRRGGHAVAHGSGDLGELLFSAGAGVADLGRIQKQLEIDAEELFKPRGSKQRINEATGKLKEATQRVRTHLLPTARWRDLDKAVRDAETRRNEIDAELGTHRKRVSYLDRVESALPLIGKKQELTVAFESVVDAPRLPKEFSETRSQLVVTRRHAESSKRDAQRDIESLREKIDAIVLPTGLLEKRTTINELKDRLGAWQKAQKDRPALITRKQSAEERVVEILGELGKPLDLTAAEHLKVSSILSQRIQSLAKRHVAVQTELNGARSRKATLERELKSNQERIAALPPDTDTRPLRRTLRDVAERGQLDQKLKQAEESASTEEDNAQRKLSQLRLWRGQLDELEQLPIPAIDTIERFEGELHDADRSLQQAMDDLDKLQQENEELTREQKSLELEQRVPTEAELESARRRRDEGWNLLVRILDGTQPAEMPETASFIHEFAPDGNLQDAFHASVSQADEISDRLRREADRVLRLAQLRADIDSNQSQQRTQSEKCDDRRGVRSELQKDWEAQWEAVGIRPLPPREMRSWLRSHEELTVISRTLRTYRLEVESVSADIKDCRDSLVKCLASLGKSPEANGGSLRSLVDQCTEIADSIEEDNRIRRECAQELDRNVKELKNVEQALAQAVDAAEEWQSEWEQAIAELDVTAASDPDVANSILQLITKLEEELRDRNRFEERITGVDNESTAFADDVRVLVEAVAPDLLDSPIASSVDDLFDRLTRAEKDHVKQEGLEQQLSDAEKRLNDASSNGRDAEQHLQELCTLAGANSVDELPEIERRAGQRTELERQIAEVNSRLTDLAAGVSLHDFAESVSEYDVDAVRAEKGKLDDCIASLENERRITDESIGENRNELQRMDGQSLAAEAQQQAELLVSEIRQDAEEFIRLHLASVVLKQAIERYRESSQGPVLERASDLFARLTLNSFSGLRAEFNDKGEAVIVGVRAENGRLVYVHGMSEGTCDQLYLALRLAVLEASISSGRHLPFVVDDVLIMFDDVRAAAALQVFAELSSKTQVIFFTHHEHLIELARATVPDTVLFVHQLEGSGTP